MSLPSPVYPLASSTEIFCLCHKGTSELLLLKCSAVSLLSIANKDKFIWAVRELSETYEIDADLKEDDDGYTAFLYMNYASYNGYIKKLLGLIFILSDDFSMFKAKDNRDSDLLMCFTYHTHNVYLKDREITDFA